MQHIEGNHTDHTQINQGCRMYTGGGLGWEWRCLDGFVSIKVDESIPRSFQIIYMVIMDLWPSWDTMDAMRWWVCRKNGWFIVGSDLGEMGCWPWWDSMARWYMAWIKQNKDTKYHLLGHNRAITNRFMVHIDGNHTNQTQINQGCRGYTGGGLGWEWGYFGGFVSFIVGKSIPRSLQIIYMVIKDLWLSWDAMDAMRWQVFRQNSWFRVSSDLGEMGCWLWWDSVARWYMGWKETKQRSKILFVWSWQRHDQLIYGYCWWEPYRPHTNQARV